MVYAYAICCSDAPPPAPRGLGGVRLSMVRSDGLAAVCSRHRSLRPQPTRANVLRHERVIEAAMRHGPVLPFRFATQLASADELAALLQERRDELRRALERVRDRVELGLRALPSPGAGVPSPPAGEPGEERGRRYLLARVALRRRAELVARELHDPLSRGAVASVVSERPAPPAVFVAAYLVEAGRVEAFRARTAELSAGLADLEVFLTGPLPPYNFVDWRPDADRR